MDLQQFVKTTLNQVIAAIQGVQQEQSTQELAKRVMVQMKDELVEFDVAVVVEEAENKQLGGGLKVVGLKAGGGIDQSSSTQSTSRVRFAVKCHVLDQRTLDSMAKQISAGPRVVRG